MKRKSLSNRRKTGKGRIAAVLALAVLLGAAPAIKTDAYPEGPYKITLNAPGDEAYADLVNADVIVDVYKVASAVPQDGTDAYTLSFEDAFKSTEQDYIDKIQKPSEPGGTGVDSASVDAFAQTLEGIALDPTKPVSHGSATVSTAGGTFSAEVTIDKGEAGMYLLIPHGNMADYIYVSEDPQSTYKATIANGTAKQYIFAPILVTVPNRGLTTDFGTGTIDASEFTYPIEVGNTANREAWDESEVDIDLKIGWKDLLTRFQINKDLVNYETMSNRTDPAVFVFRIDAVDNKGNNVFSDVRSISLTEATTSDPITIDNVPVGATVTVSEDYPGADYKCIGAAITGTTGNVDSNNVVTFTSIPAPAEDEEDGALVLVTFKNDYTDTWKDSGSVTNKFTREKNEGDGLISWKWTPENTHKTAEVE